MKGSIYLNFSDASSINTHKYQRVIKNYYLNIIFFFANKLEECCSKIKNFYISLNFMLHTIYT